MNNRRQLEHAVGDMPAFATSMPYGSSGISPFYNQPDLDRPDPAENLIRAFKQQQAQPVLAMGLGCFQETKQTEEQKSMKRIVKVFVVDPDQRVPAEQSLLAQSEEQFTDKTDQELFFDLDIRDSLAKHNEARVKIIDKQATARSGRDVFLEPIKIRDLKMQVVQIAQF